MDIKEMGCKVVDWIHLLQDRVRWKYVISLFSLLLEMSQ